MHCSSFWPCSCCQYAALCSCGLQPGSGWDCLLSSGTPSQLCKLTAGGLSFLENEEPTPFTLPLGCTASDQHLLAGWMHPEVQGLILLTWITCLNYHPQAPAARGEEEHRFPSSRYPRRHFPQGQYHNHGSSHFLYLCVL